MQPEPQEQTLPFASSAAIARLIRDTDNSVALAITVWVCPPFTRWGRVGDYFSQAIIS